MRKIKFILFPLVLLFAVAFTGTLIRANTPETVNVALTSVFDGENTVSQGTVSRAYGSKFSFDSNVESGLPQDYTFAYWVVNGAVRPDLPIDHEFTITTQLELVAVFSPVDKHTVLFMDSNGKLLKTAFVANQGTASDDGITLPSKPSYTVKTGEAKWNAPLTDITSDTVFILQYEKDATDLLTLVVNNGTGDSEEYEYNEVVTAVADAPVGGLYFSHWEENGKKVSSQSEYSFTMLTNREITAVYSETEPTDLPFVSISDDLQLRDWYRSYLGHFYVPAGYTYVEHGILLSRGEGSITFASPNVTVKQSNKFNAQTNEYLMSVPMGSHAIARAYLVVKQGETVSTFYSDNIVTHDITLQVEYLDFEAQTKGSYDAAPITVNDKDWILSDTVIGTSDSDRKVGAKSARIRDGFISSGFVFVNGIESIRFQYAKYGSDADSELLVQYAYAWDDENWMTVQDDDTDLVINVNSTNIQNVEVLLEIYAPIYVRLIKTGTARVNVDSLIINYSNYVDDVDPIISVTPVYASIMVGESYDNSLVGVSAIDNIDGILTSNITFEVRDEENDLVEEPGDFSTLPAGEYTIVYSVTDSNLNTGTNTRTLEIIEEIIEYENSETFSNFAGTASYTSGSFVGDDEVIVWHYTNARGDVALNGKAVMLQNNTAANLTATIAGGISNFTILYTKAFTTNAAVELYINDLLIATSDISTVASTPLVFTVNDIDIEGEFTITLKTTGGQLLLDDLQWDSYGINTGYNPVISGAINTTIVQGDSFDPLSDVSASDFEDGDLTSEITYTVKDSSETVVETPGNFSGLAAGEYTITYSVEDSDGNIATKSITLTIQEETSELTETLIYETGFESSEGFSAGTTYNNTTINYQGPADKRWGFYYGTPSTTGSITGSQSAQMRFYTANPDRLGYAVMVFELNGVTKVTFKALNTSGNNVAVSYSTDGGTTFGNSQTFTLGTSAADFTYTISETGINSVRVKFTLVPGTTNGSRVTIDDVKIYGMR